MAKALHILLTIVSVRFWDGHTPDRGLEMVEIPPVPVPGSKVQIKHAGHARTDPARHYRALAPQPGEGEFLCVFGYDRTVIEVILSREECAFKS